VVSVRGGRAPLPGVWVRKRQVPCDKRGLATNLPPRPLISPLKITVLCSSPVAAWPGLPFTTLVDEPTRTPCVLTRPAETSIVSRDVADYAHKG
jgi:hypothetical protein